MNDINGRETTLREDQEKCFQEEAAVRTQPPHTEVRGQKLKQLSFICSVIETNLNIFINKLHSDILNNHHHYD